MFIFYSIFLLDSFASTQKEKVLDFSKITLGKHLRNDCTPAVPENEKVGVWVRFPNVINWGDPLPVCGVMRYFKKDLTSDKKIRFYFKFEKPITFNSEIQANYPGESS